MASGALEVEFVGCGYSIFEARDYMLEQVVLVAAVEEEEVLHCELLVLVPAQPQPLHSLPKGKGPVV